MMKIEMTATLGRLHKLLHARHWKIHAFINAPFKSFGTHFQFYLKWCGWFFQNVYIPSMAQTDTERNLLHRIVI